MVEVVLYVVQLEMQRSAPTMLMYEWKDLVVEPMLYGAPTTPQIHVMRMMRYVLKMVMCRYR